VLGGKAIADENRCKRSHLIHQLPPENPLPGGVPVGRGVALSVAEVWVDLRRNSTKIAHTLKIEKQEQFTPLLFYPKFVPQLAKGKLSGNLFQ
jgi:hypothetical protein